MALKLSIFTTVTLPEARGDMYKEALSCYTDLADEVVIIYGRKKDLDYPLEYTNNGAKVIHVPTMVDSWPKEFAWPTIGEHFQRGYESCTGDWAIHMDLDFIFHQKDFGKIRQALKDYPNAPAISFYKWQFILPDRYNLKSRLLLAVNSQFKDKIKFDSGGDLCQPSFNGDQINLNDMPQAGVPFYNYEKILKTKEQVMNDQGRMERAYFRHFGHYQLARNDSDKSAYEGWLNMQYGRLNKPHAFIKLEEHPKYMHDTLLNLKPEQFGYSAFGYGENNYVKSYSPSR